MNRLAFSLPVLPALADGAQAQTQGKTTCPQLSTDSGLNWQHKAIAKTDFCRTLRANGSEAFGLNIADQMRPNPASRPAKRCWNCAMATSLTSGSRTWGANSWAWRSSRRSSGRAQCGSSQRGSAARNRTKDLYNGLFTL